jgi:GT2 family glycosyltransferase
MISIVVCSIDEGLFIEFSRSVERTIGVPFEIIRIDNTIEKRGICAAYNQGAGRARYDILCFSHEDIGFVTNGWGTIVVDLFTNNSNLGALGIAGSTFRARTPTGWAVDRAHDKANVIQGFTNKPDSLYYRNESNDRISRVVQLDGLWICVKRSAWEAVTFNEREYPGFHYYDIDFSLRIHLHGFEVCVTYAIVMRHRSGGTYGREWISESRRFFEHWKDRLPISLGPTTSAEIRQLTLSVYDAYFNFLLDKTAKRYSFIYLRGCVLSKPLSRSNVKRTLKWLLWGTALEKLVRQF